MTLHHAERRHLRYHFPCTVEYVVNSEGNARALKGVVINVCNGGLCLCVFDPLAEGAEITIRSFLPVEPRKASVRWIKKVDDNYYRAGLMFAE